MEARAKEIGSYFELFNPRFQQRGRQVVSHILVRERPERAAEHRRVIRAEIIRRRFEGSEQER